MKQHITIKINNKAINLVVFIDSTLSWKHQISNISKKISRAMALCINCDLLTFEGNEKCILQHNLFPYYMQLKHGAQLAKLNWIRFLFCRKGRGDLRHYDKYPTIYGALISSDPIFC